MARNRLHAFPAQCSKGGGHFSGPLDFASNGASKRDIRYKLLTHSFSQGI